MRILVAGDRFCHSSAFQEAFKSLSGDHDVTFVDVVDEPDWRPERPSELRLRETMGSPRQVIEALDGHEVLVIQGAPVSDASQCRRGTPLDPAKVMETAISTMPPAKR